MLSGQEEKILNEPQRACWRKPQLGLVLSKEYKWYRLPATDRGSRRNRCDDKSTREPQENMSTQQAPRGAESPETRPEGTGEQETGLGGWNQPGGHKRKTEHSPKGREEA